MLFPAEMFVLHSHSHYASVGKFSCRSFRAACRNLGNKHSCKRMVRQRTISREFLRGFRCARFFDSGFFTGIEQLHYDRPRNKLLTHAKRCKGFVISDLQEIFFRRMHALHLITLHHFRIWTTRYGYLDKKSSTFCVFPLTEFFQPLILQLQIRGIVEAPDGPVEADKVRSNHETLPSFRNTIQREVTAPRFCSREVAGLLFRLSSIH